MTKNSMLNHLLNQNKTCAFKMVQLKDMSLEFKFHKVSGAL